MQVPVQITFRDIPSSDAIEARIHEETEKLEKIYDNITSCRVIIESLPSQPQKREPVSHRHLSQRARRGHRSHQR